MQNKLRIFFSLSTAFFAILSDRAVKHWALKSLDEGVSRPIFGNLLNLTLVKNKGVAFGFFSDNRLTVFFSIITGFFALFYIINSVKKKNILFYSAVSLIAVGAVSNIYDRIKYGFVVDMLDLKVWPVFNLADVFISAGAVLIFIFLIKDNN